MKWTVLSDNRSRSTSGRLQGKNDSRLSTEHGLSILLETTNEGEQCDARINIAERGGVRRSQTEQHKILLDTGASDVFIKNAEQLGLDLSTVDYVFISHGHSDHAGGLRYFLEKNRQAKVIVSPDAMSGKFYSKRGNLHSITTEWPEIDKNRLILINQTCEIEEDIHVIAHIPQTHPMPKGNQNLFVKPNEQNEACFNSVMARKGRMKSNLYVQNANGETTNEREQCDACIDIAERGGVRRSQYIHDDFRHELALYVDGLLFTGCAHSGLENILAACPWPVHTVVGGFHLLDGQESEEELAALAHRLKEKYPETQFYTSHCTGDHVFEVMRCVMGEQLQSFRCGDANLLLI